MEIFHYDIRNLKKIKENGVNIVRKFEVFLMRVCMFPGQGSQKHGMGKSLFSKYPEYVKKSDEVLGYSIEELCLNPEKINYLNMTEYTQPALYLLNTLNYMEFLKDNHLPEYFIGHSLGEYNALQAARIIDFETGMRLVQKRGELMGRIKDGAMAAILNMPLLQIKQILAENNLSGIDIANINSNTEIVISGLKNELTKCTEILEKHGAYIIRLNVSGAFHSRYMEIILEEYKKILSKTKFAEPKIPVISNYSVCEYTKENALENLLLQIVKPVRWVDTIEYLKRKGCCDFIQIGSGRVLIKLCNNILNTPK